jgi:hypothetical protein
MSRDVVGMIVRLEHVLDRHSEEPRDLEVLLDLEARVHDGGDAGAVVADQIRRASEVVLNDLSKQH